MDHHNTSKRRRDHSPSPHRRDQDDQDSRETKRHRHRHRHEEKKPTVARLPFRSHHLHKRDFESYQALFAEYLDLQKQIDITSLTEDELKGRWKSFLGKWNRAELAEGWYEPATKTRADDRAPSNLDQRKSREVEGPIAHADHNEDDSEDDGYGPPPPAGPTQGPTIPGFQDLQHARELAEEDRSDNRASLRHERKQDRQNQKERLEELVPRADPGTRERQLEKKRETAQTNRSFAEAKEAGAEDVGDGDLMGDDGVDKYKAQVRDRQRAKNEREIRKEEVLRAREAEREVRVAKHREKEEKTMDYLRSLAQQRFGGGGAQ